MSLRELNKYERAAMWLYGQDYADSRLSAIDFWAKLSRSRQNNVIEMVDEILAAPFGTWNNSPLRRVGASQP